MKLNILAIMTLLSSIGCVKQSDPKSENFQSQRISKSASFEVNEKVSQVFPLYGAFEERKWAPGWEPNLIYPENEIIEEGTTFSVAPHDSNHGDEGPSLWIVSKYKPNLHLIQYLVSTKNRFWTITVKSEAIADNSKTKTTVTYTFTGLTKKGNKLNQKNLDRMFENDLQDWAELINNYIEHKPVPSHH